MLPALLWGSGRIWQQRVSGGKKTMLPEDEIKQAILHSEEEERLAALDYFSGLINCLTASTLNSLLNRPHVSMLAPCGKVLSRTRAHH